MRKLAFLNRRALGHAALCGAAALLLATGQARADFSDGKIKMGILDDFSGQYCVADCKGPINAVQIAIDEFGGKINGTPIELIWGDHQDKPDAGVSIANKWYDVEQVDVILDVVNSAVALAVQEIARNKGKAVMYSEAGSADLTGKACAPYSAAWTYDTYQFARTLREAVPFLGKKWFVLAADYNFGKLLAAGVQANVPQAGGEVLGVVYHPFGASDFSSFILQVQAAKPDVLALADAGGDMTNAIKAAKEFGLIDAGIKIVPMSLDLTLIEGMGGLELVQGMFVPLPWYSGLKPAALKFSQEFKKRQGTAAPYLMAGLYSAARTYLLAAQATNSDDPKLIFDWMHHHIIDDAFTNHGVLRPDGRMVHDVFLTQLKKPSESSGPDDLSKLVATIPGDKAFRPMAEGGCPYIKN